MARLAALFGAAALLLAGTPVLIPGVGPQAQAAQAAEPTEEQKKAEARLLEVGKVAPDFTLPLVGGGEVTLSNLLKGGKGVIVTFWGIDPESGGGNMEKLQKVHAKFENKGLATVAINPEDSMADVKEFVEMSKLHYLVAIDGKETNRAVTGVYKSRTLPTLYVLDPEGKVAYRAVAYREEALVQALEKLGIK